VENLDPGGTGIFDKPERTGRSAMTDQPSRAGLDVEVKPHAYDPIAHPELFEGVLTRRVLAFIVDVLIITIPIVLVSIFIFLFGIFTLGLGWLLFWLVSPASAIWAIVYYGFTMGSPASATYGMARSISKSAPGMAAPAISCSAPCMRSCSGYRSRRSRRSSCCWACSTSGDGCSTTS
jgi:hypothetical protein